MGFIEVLGHIRDGIIQGIQIDCPDKTLVKTICKWTDSLKGHYFEYESIKQTTETYIDNDMGEEKHIVGLIAGGLLEYL